MVAASRYSTLSRRTLVLGSAGLPVLWISAAEASWLSAIWGTVGTSLLQGLGFIDDIAKMVDLGITAASSLTGVQVPPSALNPIVKEVQSWVQSRSSGNKSVQGVPIHVNASDEDSLINYSYNRASKPLDLKSSDEDHLHHDPVGYVNENGDLLVDYIKRFPAGVIPQTASIGPKQIIARPVYYVAPRQSGYYGSIIDYGDKPAVSVFRPLG
jgi:hypothetical protein